MRHILSSHTFGYRLNPVVLLLNGAMSNSAMWPTNFIHQIVDSGFCVVTLDHRDTGKNNWDKMHFTIDDMVDDIFYTMIVNRINCPHFIGSSMGGNIALRFALKYPKSCKSLTIYSSTPGKCFTDTCLKPPTTAALQAMCTESYYFKKDDVKGALFHRYKTFSAKNDSTIHKIVQRSIRRGINSNAKHPEAFYYAPSIIDKLEDIRQSSLIIHGEDDNIFPIDHAWKMHHEIPNSKLYILPKINHYFQGDTQVGNIIIKHISNDRSMFYMS